MWSAMLSRLDVSCPPLPHCHLQTCTPCPPTLEHCLFRHQQMLAQVWMKCNSIRWNGNTEFLPILNKGINANQRLDAFNCHFVGGSSHTDFIITHILTTNKSTTVSQSYKQTARSRPSRETKKKSNKDRRPQKKKSTSC